MIRFLRLFAIFRALEADRDATVLQLREALQDLTTEKLLLQDRLDGVLNDRGELWTMVRESVSNERDALKMMANYRMQATFGVTPYPEAGVLPESREPHQMEPLGRRMTPSEMVAQGNARFIEKLKTHGKQ